MSMKGLLALHAVEAPRLEVTIDGVPYAPFLGPRDDFAIAITTKDRWTILESNLTAFEKHTPADVPILVWDDGSDRGPETWPERFTLLRSDTNEGIARAKNRCLDWLYATGKTHLFLFDDDTFPNAPDWWVPYVRSPEPHLMRIFEDLAGNRKLNDIRPFYRDAEHVAYTGPRGIMLYAERRVLDAVGGMDPIYGKWGWEHGDWSNRIHNAGLTTWRYADVAGSEKLIFSLDEHQRVDRTTDLGERQAQGKRNIETYREREFSSEYVEFRTQKDMVLTCLYTDVPDPQRPAGKRLTDESLAALGGSLVPAFAGDEVNLTIFRGPLGVDNLYVQRWYDYWRYLRDHPELRFVWCVDGTDVEMLRNPFPEMQPGILYLGSEPKDVDDVWMQRNQSTPMRKVFREHFADYQRAALLNAGLVGGDRATVMRFVRAMLDVYETNQINTFLKKDVSITENVNDMGMLNAVGYSGKFRVETGPKVHTVFKANERNEVSWWKHK